MNWAKYSANGGSWEIIPFVALPPYPLILSSLGALIQGPDSPPPYPLILSLSKDALY